MTVSFTDVLVERVLNSKANDFNSNTIESAKINIADTIVCGILGYQAPGIRELVDWVDSFNSSGNSSIWMYGKNVPPAFAGLCNASMAHAYDFDDTHDAAILHAGIGVVPAALACATNLPQVSGMDFIRSIIWGIETSSLLSLATPEGPNQSGWAFTSLYSYYSSVVASASIYGLTSEQLHNALGISYSLSAGNVLCIPQGSLSKRMQPGFGVKSGIMSTELAMRGITGPENPFESKMGLFQVYHKTDFPENMSEWIGAPFQINELSYKPYPCCRFNHSAIDAAISLHKKFTDRNQLESIKNIKVIVSDQAYYALCQPLDRKRNPQSVVDAQFSIPYTVSTALLKGNVTIQDFQEESFMNGKQLSIAQKVVPVTHQSLSERGIAGTTVEVNFENGEQWVETVQTASGQPGDFESLWNIVWSKLQDTQIEDKEGLFKIFKNLEQEQNLNRLMSYLKKPN